MQITPKIEKIPLELKIACLEAHIFQIMSAAPDMTPDSDYVASKNHTYQFWALCHIPVKRY